MSPTTLLEILRAHRLDDDPLYTLAEHALAQCGNGVAPAIDAVWQATAAQREACAAELYGRVDVALLHFFKVQIREQREFIQSGDDEGGGVPLFMAYIIIARMLEEAAARGGAPPPPPPGIEHPMLRGWPYQHF